MEKIFYTDQYISEFTARVQSCEKTDRGFALALDRTAFFPEQGGQSCDEGTLNGIGVTDVQIKEGIISHFTEEPIPAGTAVTGKIDFQKRFDRMQNHTGEHIVSGVIHNLFGYDNVGFHLSDTEMTLDTSGPLTKEQLAEVEARANKTVWDNVPVDILYPTPTELENISYRSKLDLKENVRLVKIGDVDICACCAPHVKNTGEIGMIKIVKAMRYKGGMRLNLCCGSRAYGDSCMRFEETEKITSLLKVKSAEISGGVETLLEKYGDAQYELKSLRKELIRRKISGENFEGVSVCVKSDINDMDVLREAVNLCMEKTDGFCMAVSGTGEEGFVFVLGKRDSEVARDASSLLTALQGKGGGRGNMISGRLGCDGKTIEGHFTRII